MDINNKCLELLIFLLRNEGYIEINVISNKFKIGNRAVRYRLDKIDQFLLSKGFKALDRSYGSGVRLIKSEKLLSELDSFCSAYTPKNYTFSKEERQNFIKSELLQADEPILVPYLMSVLGVSRNTILKELSELENFFEIYKLKLIRKRRLGIYLEGEEKYKRIALFKVNSEMIAFDDLFNYIYTGTANTKINNLQFDSLFADINIEEIDEILLDSQRALGYEFSDMAYGNLITHIVIMIKRIRIGKEVILIDANIDAEKFANEIGVSKDMAKSIEDAFDITIPPSEINYLVLHILSAKIKKGTANSDADLIDCINEMIAEFEGIYGINLDEIIRENLKQGLLLHLRPALNRIKFNLSIENPLFSDVLSTYPELFLNTKILCKKLENTFDILVNDQEASYVLMHFGAVLKNINIIDKPIDIVLVCASGIGTVNMLKSQLEMNYHVNIKDIIGIRDISKYDKNYDYIVSSINIADVDKEKFIYINALLLEEDYAKLDKKLVKKNRVIHNKNKVLNELLSLIEANTKVHNEEELTLGIIKILSNIENK